MLVPRLRAPGPSAVGPAPRVGEGAHLIRSDPAAPSLHAIAISTPQHLLPFMPRAPPQAPNAPNYPQYCIPPAQPARRRPQDLPPLPLPQQFGGPPVTLSHQSPTSELFPTQPFPAVHPAGQLALQPGGQLGVEPGGQLGGGQPSIQPGIPPNIQPQLIVQPTAQPISKTWDIPPRPKPGRKPTVDAPANKRKAQNRASQRAFRARRAQQLSEAREDFQKREDRLQLRIAQLIAENADLRAHNARLEFENTGLKGQLDTNSRVVTHLSMKFNNASSKRQRELPPLSPTYPPASHSQTEPLIGCGTCGKDGRCECMEKILNVPDAHSSRRSSTTRNEPSDEMEIDMTGFGKNNSKNPVVADDSDQPSMGTPLDDNCGFCTDSTNCVCRAAANVAQPQPAITTQNILTPPDSTGGDEVRRLSLDKPQPLEPQSSARGPGTCPSCISDPERRRFCQTLAKVNPPKSRPLSSSGIPLNTILDQRRPSDESEYGDSRVSCADAYTLLSNDPNFERNRTNPQFLERLRVETPTVGRQCHSCNSQGCSSYEVDCISILAAMREEPDS